MCLTIFQKNSSSLEYKKKELKKSKDFLFFQRGQCIGFGQIAFQGYIGFSSPFDIVKHFFLLHLENIDVQIKIFNFDPKPWVVLFGKSNRVFSHDVKAAILVSQNNETAAMLVSQTSPVGVELFSYANAFFCCNKFTQMLIT